MAQLVKNLPAMGETWVWPPGWEDPLEKGIAIDSIIPFVFEFDNLFIYWGFPFNSVGKESTCNAGDLGLIPGWGRYPGEGNGYPLQYSGLGIPWTV